MASIEKREGEDGRARWVARYRDANGRQRNKTFARKIDAERYLTGIEGAKLTGQYVDPVSSRVTVATGRICGCMLRPTSHLRPAHGTPESSPPIFGRAGARSGCRT
jgi:hypothetical protein